MWVAGKHGHILSRKLVVRVLRFNFSARILLNSRKHVVVMRGASEGAQTSRAHLYLFRYCTNQFQRHLQKWPHEYGTSANNGFG